MVMALFERLAQAAAGEILTVKKAGIDVQRKDDNTPVTEADMRAEAVILAGLENELPEIPHVGEEEVSNGTVPGDLGDCFVLVDPLDGTREFVAGRSEFTVNIALIRGGVPVVGVVMVPATGVVYSASPSVAERFEIHADGSKGQRERIFATKQAQTVRIVASRSHRTAETDQFISQYECAEIISTGSSLKFCLLAEGKADLYPRFGRTMEWDTAAGDAILRAAGGTTCLVDGSALLYGKRNQPNDCDFANPWFISRGA